MRTLCLTLAYDGSTYCGWQRQPNGTSLQEVVERALSEFVGEPVKAAASGRTDAGVHAIGQLVSFHTASTIPVEGFRRGLITQLPADIVLREVVECPYGFHARFDSVRKRYRYVIHSARSAWPWLQKYAWWHRGPLDDAAMQSAADLLVGTHDFRCFESKWPNRSSSVRTIYEARWWRCAEWLPWGDGRTHQADEQSSEGASPSRDFLCFDVVADGFLYNMVRAIVGTLVHVGRGRWTAADMRRILETGDRSHAGDTAPAHGLYLVDVETRIDLERIAARIARWRRNHGERGDVSPPGD